MKITSKIINKFTVALSVVFFVFAIFSVIYETAQYNNFLIDLNDLVNSANEFNFNHNLDLTQDQPEDIEPIEEFENGKDAFYNAYYDLYSSSSYHLKTYGTMDMMLNIGFEIEVNMLTEYTLLKYEDGTLYMELITFVTKGGEYKDHSSVIFYYNSENEKYYIRKTQDVEITGTTPEGKSELTAYYDKFWVVGGEQEFLDVVGVQLGVSFYDFGIMNLTSETQFTKVKNPRTGQTDKYIVGINSNASRAGELYGKLIDYVAESSEDTEVTRVEQSAEIDAGGKLLTMNISEDFNLETVQQGITVKVLGTSTNTYYFVSLNKPIDIEKPVPENDAVREAGMAGYTSESDQPIDYPAIW